MLLQPCSVGAVRALHLLVACMQSGAELCSPTTLLHPHSMPCSADMSGELQAKYEDGVSQQQLALEPGYHMFATLTCRAESPFTTHGFDC